MAIGPANPVYQQFRMNSFTPDTADKSAKSDTAAPPDTDRPTYKLRRALGLPSIPPVAVKLPPPSTTRPASEATSKPDGGLGGQSGSASRGLPTGGRGGLAQSRPRPPAGGNSRSSMPPAPPATLPETGPLSAGRPALPTIASQSIKQSLDRGLSSQMGLTGGALSAGRPAPPDFSVLASTAPQALGSPLGPTTSTSLPPPPAPVLEGTSRFEKIDPEEAAARRALQEERRETEEHFQRNIAERSQLKAERQQIAQAQRAQEGGVPPAYGSDSMLIDAHPEPPFDPAIRRELGRQPRQARGRVARRDSVLYDQVGARERVNRSADRFDATITKQREVGRREFEMRQRRNAVSAGKSEARAEQRRFEEFQRLEASEAQEVLTRARARRQAIETSTAEGNIARDAAAVAVNERVDLRRSRGQELVNSAQQRHGEVLNTTANARSSAISSRQRDVFKLQLEFANTRRLAEKDPPPTVGAESRERLAESRVGGEIFQTLRDNRQTALNRIERGRTADVAEKGRRGREIDTGRQARAQERSQNIRRRLDSSYSGRASKQVGQRVGQSA
jgi:hypothetical protein